MELSALLRKVTLRGTLDYCSVGIIWRIWRAITPSQRSFAREMRRPRYRTSCRSRWELKQPQPRVMAAQATLEPVSSHTMSWQALDLSGQSRKPVSERS